MIKFTPFSRISQSFGYRLYSRLRSPLMNGEFRIVKIRNGKYELYRWLVNDLEWCFFGTYRSKVSAVREVYNMIPEGE